MGRALTGTRAEVREARRTGVGQTSLLVAILVAACSSSPAPSPASVPSGAVDGPTASAPGAPVGGAAEAAAAAVDIQALADVAAFENEAVDGVATAAGIPAFLGDSTWAFAEALLRDTLASAGQDVGLGGGPILLASVGNPPPLPPVRAAVDGGGGVGLGMAMGLAIASLGEGGAPLRNLNTSLDSTQETTANGERTVGTVTGHLQMTSSGSTLTADVEIGVDVTVTDVASGAVRRTASFRSRGTIKLDFCPDSSGKVHGHVTMHLDGGTSGAGSASLDVDTDVTGTVGDDAYLQTIDGSGTSTQTSAPPGGGPARRSVVSFGMSAGVSRAGTMNTSGISAQGSVVEESQPLTDAEVTQAYTQIAKAVGAAVGLLGSAAQEQWRGGACVEIHATEQSRDVKKNELVQFEATPFHKIEQVDLAKPIVPEFAGKASLDPIGIAVPAPVLLSFKAGPNANDTGTITLTSTSNRGIGTLDITFRVTGGWVIDAPSGGGRIHGQKCGDPTGKWEVDGTYKQLIYDGAQSWEITIKPDAQNGTFEYTTTATATVGGVTVYLFGFANGTVTLSIDPVTGEADMHFKEQKHTFVTTTDAGGSGADQGAPLQQYDLHWDVGGTC